MPPKQAPSKKTEQKKKEKVIEDKTFGLKNKKGAKQQKFVQQVTNQVKQTSIAKQQAEFAKKKDKTDELDDLNKLLKPVATAAQKVDKDVDPKSILCLFFKQGMCTKGNKCKWSHDLSIEQKVVKRNLYVDSRDLEKEENMDDWDENKLSEVAEKKHGDADRKRPNQTDIVCKFFIEAVENSKYGWFWECPNGERCIYRHALPPGYVLKKDKKTLEDLKKRDQVSLEDLIEKERACLSSKNLTKVTLETFIAWKKRKLREKKKAEDEAEKAKREKVNQGKHGGMSGRDLFTYNPDLIQDDDEADDVGYDDEANDNEEDAGPVFEIDEKTFFNIEGLDMDDIDEPGVSDGVAKMTIDADLFDDAGVEDLDSDEELSDENPDRPGPSRS